MYRRETLQVGILGILSVICLLVWTSVVQTSPSNGNTLTVWFLDVGQGDATFIETPSKKRMLIDGGAGKSLLRELGEVMPFSNRTIDVVMATHPDQDHIGGLPYVFERYDIGTYLSSGVLGSSQTYQELNRRVAEEGSVSTTALRGQIIDFGDGVQLHILFPDRDVRDVESNLGSIIAQLTYGETEFLLTGDAPRSIETYLVSLGGEALESDVLKVGHHGSKTSSAPAFVGFVSPEFAVISAGKDNRYGHPHEEVLETLKQFEVELFSTAESGTITFESNGKTARQK